MERRKRTKIIIYVVSIIFFLFSLFFLNSFLQPHQLWIQLLFWLVLGIILYDTFPPMKERKKEVSSTIRMMLRILFLYYSIVFLLGLWIGYGNNQISISFKFLLTQIVPFILILFFQEYVRGKLLFQTTFKERIFLTILFTLATSITVFTIYQNQDIILTSSLIITIILSSITSNMLYTYLTYDKSYKLSLLFRYLTELMLFIIPIFPQVSTIWRIIFTMLLPILVLDQLYRYSPYQRRHFDKGFRLLFYPVMVVFIFVFVLVTGISRYQMIAVASNSMKPVFRRGDTIVFDKKDKNIEVNDIIVFKRNNQIVIHRVSKIIKQGNKLYYETKGDNNSLPDHAYVSEKDVIGTVTGHVSYLGYPSIWIKELI